MNEITLQVEAEFVARGDYLFRGGGFSTSQFSTFQFLIRKPVMRLKSRVAV